LQVSLQAFLRLMDRLYYFCTTFLKYET